MPDLELTRNSPILLVAGDTDEGIDFVDGYMPGDPEELVVVDSGRIILPEGETDRLLAAARESGLTVTDA